MEQPLASFCLMSYNQRQWIGSALEAAFAQTYRPLEIVISDDGSTDGSVELIQEMIDSHAPSDITVIFKRNPQNVGMFGNWMKLVSCAHGEIFVKADGDDISLPERTEKIVAAWLADGKRAAVICHGGFRMDLDGRPLGSAPAPCAKVPVGALMAWRRDCYTSFPPGTVHDRCAEDLIFARRAMMLGGELVIPDRLIKYRTGSGLSTTLYHHRTPVIKAWRDWFPCLDQTEHDLAAIADRLPPKRVEDFRRIFEHERDFAQNHLALVESPSFRTRWAAFRREQRMGRWNSYVFLLAYLLPRRLGDWVLDTITRLNQLRRRLSR